MKFGGAEALAVLDTGSKVTTMTESWYRQFLHDRPLQQVSWLSLKAANGLDIPYVGLLSGGIELFGTVVEASILVVRDPEGQATVEHRTRTPLLVGMNVLQKLYPTNRRRQEAQSPLLDAVIRQVRLHSKSVLGLARVVGTIQVPALSVATIQVSGPRHPSLVAEPCHHPLPGGLIVVPTLVSQSSYPYYLRVANLNEEPVTIKDRTAVAAFHAAKTLTNDTVVTVNSHEVHVSSENAEERPVDPRVLAKINECGASGEQKQQLLDLFAKYSEVISADDLDLGYTNKVEHTIRTTDDVPVAQAHRPIAPRDFHEVKDHIQELLKKEIIQPTSSPYAAPIVVVRKKDGSIRLCVDYRRLNNKTVKDAYPLPRIEESLHALSGAQLFTTLDLASGYHQIAMAPEDRQKTAFVTPFGLYEHARMPFGLTGAPATFQRLMNSIMSDVLFNFLLVYLDDLLIYSRTFESHLEHLEQILQKLRDAGLKLNIEKCHILREEVSYLGHTISKEGIGCQTEKTEAIQKWPTPTTTKEVRSFLGFTGYYRRFVKHYARIAAPLNDLVNQNGGLKRKSRPISIRDKWEAKHQAAFDQLKDALTSPDVLAFADFSLPFLLETDASHEGLGAILSQKQADGRYRVIAYASRRLRQGEKNAANYSSFKLELLALKWAVSEKFRGFLLGSTFEVLTDNNPVAHFQTSNLGALEQRWAAQLAQFDFTVKYRSGRLNRADALSRNPIPEPETVCRAPLPSSALPTNHSPVPGLLQTAIQQSLTVTPSPGAADPPHVQMQLVPSLTPAEKAGHQRADPVGDAICDRVVEKAKVRESRSER